MLLPCCLGFVDSNLVIEATKQEKMSTFILSHGVSVLQYQHAGQNIPTGSMLSWLLWGNQFYFIKFEYYSKGGVHVWHYNPSQKPMTLKVIGLRVKKKWYCHFSKWLCVKLPSKIYSKYSKHKHLYVCL